MKRKNILLIIGVLLLVAGMIGVSYAAWVLEFEQEKKSTIASSCFSITFTEDTDSINLTDAYPLIDADGRKLTPYTFIIKNNCEAYASYQVNLEVLESSTLTNYDFLKVMLDNKTPVLLSSNEVVTTTLDDATTSYKLGTYYLDSKESKTHNLRIWLDENVEMSDAVNNQTFDSMITIAASYSPTILSDYELCVNDYGADAKQCDILATLDTSGACPTVNEDGTIKISGVETSQSLLCSAPDDYGTSYYFRGVPENNWVKFGGYYWRIIRINGDDSVRMIYAGDANVIDALDETTKATVMTNGYNDSTTKYTQIGLNMYNNKWKKNNVLENTNSYVYYDNAAIGYMYGNRDGIVEQSIEFGTSGWATTNTYYVSEYYDYNATTDRFTLRDPVPVLASNLTTDYIGYYTMSSPTSTTSSQRVQKITNITVLEAIIRVGYSYVSYGTTTLEKAQTNTNDSDIKAFVDNWYETSLNSYSSYISDTLFCNDRSLKTSIPSGYSNLGYGLEKTAYRWYSDDAQVKFECTNKNDRFTIDDESTGNGDLTYPIGLITVDEVYAAGGSTSNASYYLYSGNSYWTMTPESYIGDNSYIFLVHSNGHTNGVFEYYENGIRPVINLLPGVLNSGDGSATNPFRVE